ncbi:hypothetical protein LTR28_005760, partial [Elasticomyces elasticus]
DDVGYLTEEIFRGRSVISGLPTRLVLCRWRKPAIDFVDTSIKNQKASRLDLRDMVLMTKDEARIHEKDVLMGDKTPEDLYDLKILKLVEQRKEEEAQFREAR